MWCKFTTFKFSGPIISKTTLVYAEYICRKNIIASNQAI